MSRRTVSGALCGVLVAGCRRGRFEEVRVAFDAGHALGASEAPRQTAAALRFSIAAMLSPEGTYPHYSQLITALGTSMGMPVTLVQRRSYRETNALLTGGRTDVAFLCTGGYLDLVRSGVGVEVLAVPVVQGESTYRSLIITRADDGVTRFDQLSGKRFAFTDELSLSGRAYPVHLARERGHDLAHFFSAAFLTGGHDHSVEAVAAGFADAAAVDSIIFAGLVARTPELGRQVKVLESSPPFGIPPVVALETLAPEVRQRVREALLSAHGDETAAGALRALNIDRFAAPPPGLFDSARAVVGAGPP